MTTKSNRHKILELKNIKASYGDFTALQDANLDVYNDDFIGIIGPNGGGKTTLLKVILNLHKQESGTINYFIDRNHIGYLPQVSNVDHKFPISILDVVISGLAGIKKLRARITRNDKQKARNILEKMGIAHLEQKTIGMLSGGQIQRVLLARAIVSEPKLLILDEPNTFVDNQFESDLYRSLKQLNEQMAILMVSHDVGTISSCVKTIACVNKNLHYHKSNKINQEQLNSYNCPIQVISHGKIPHTVLEDHQH